MKSLQVLLIILVPLLTVFQSSESFAANGKTKWELLNACQYVEDQYNDGDSFRVKCGGREFVVRLYFVDAPESNMRDAERTHQQSEHFAASFENTLKAGAKATATVRDALKAPFNIWTRWTSAAGRGKAVRYFGLVEVDGKSLIENLVSNGLARVKGAVAPLPTGEKSKVYVRRLEALEADAKRRQIGAWARSTK